MTCLCPFPLPVTQARDGILRASTLGVSPSDMSMSPSLACDSGKVGIFGASFLETMIGANYRWTLFGSSFAQAVACTATGVTVVGSGHGFGRAA